MKLTQLVHNGVLVPPAPEPHGLTLTVRGKPTPLTPKQEEMALALAKKQGTEYVQDATFVRNFMLDFSRALGIDPALRADEVDLTPAVQVVERERAARQNQSPEERKEAAAQRKAERERLRELYGYATVNGERTELGTYLVEPSGIFMGRGQHPLRGRWKEGAGTADITLNLSPDAPRPSGQWKDIVWQPENLWVARWEDQLSGKTKYIWLGDTAAAKQAREAAKFDKAIALRRNLDTVRRHIERGLADQDPRRRMIATACYLIDALGLRVGDEKDPDEADTVGATTLRPEHVDVSADRTVRFCFLGKDSVEWNKQLQVPDLVLENLTFLLDNARPPSNSNRGKGRGHPTRDKPQLFPDIASHDVNAFLGEAVAGLTAKVFRTHHATQQVEESLSGSGVRANHPEYAKWEAVNLANISAATFCNHTKKVGVNWTRVKDRFAQRRAVAEQRVLKNTEQVKAAKASLVDLRKEARESIAGAPPSQRERRQAAYDKKLSRAQQRVSQAQTQLEKARHALGRIKAQATVASKKKSWNLTTSLKSYVDPRSFHRWGQKVDYDVLGCYYPATLRRKFSWVRKDDVSEMDE